MTTRSSRRRAVVSAWLVGVALLVAAAPSFAIEDPGRPALKLSDAERAKAGVILERAAAEAWPAIERAVEIEPRILDRALEASSLDAQWLSSAGGSAIVSEGLITDLRERAALVGIANGRIGAISFGGEAEARHGALQLSRRLDPEVERWLPAAFDAMLNQRLIVNPICERADCSDQGGGTAGSGGSAIAFYDGGYDPPHFWNVVRILTKAEEGLCTGFLLNATTLLTAAHCVVSDDKTVSKDSVAIAIDGTIGDAVVTGIAVHPAFLGTAVVYPNPDYDVAVITISGVTFPGGFEFATLSPDRPQDMSEVTIAGYGHNTVAALTDLQLAKLRIGRQRLQIVDGTLPTLSWQFDASNQDLSSFCQGDSGGPMFLDRTRRNKEPLNVVGVLRKTKTIQDAPGHVVPGDSTASSCTHTVAKVVNLYAPQIRADICTLSSALGPYCNH